MQAAAKITAVLCDLRTLGVWFIQQEAAGRDTQAILETQQTKFAIAIDSLIGVSFQQGADISHAINNGPWAQDQKQDLLLHVDAVIAPGGTDARRKPFQHCKHFENYHTDLEWGPLKNANGIMKAALVSQVCGRAWSLGITHPSEPTAFRVAQFLALALGLTDTEDLEELYSDVKRTIKQFAAQRTYPHQHLVTYPRKAADLPKSMFDFAFREGSPVNVDLPGIDGAMGAVQMRGGGGGHGTRAQGMEAAAFKAGFAFDSKRGVFKQVRPQLRGRGSREALLFGGEDEPANIGDCASPAPSFGRGAANRLGAGSALASGNALAFRPLLALPKPPQQESPPPADKVKTLLDLPPAAEAEEAETAVENMLNGVGVGAGAAAGAAKNNRAAKLRIAKAKAPKKAAAKRRVGGALKQRPAQAILRRPSDGDGAEAARKRPAAALDGGAHAARRRKGGRPPMPPMDGSTKHVDYRGGRVYVSMARRAFRAIRDKTNFSTETSKVWSDDPNEAWKACLNAIDAYESR